MSDHLGLGEALGSSLGAEGRGSAVLGRSPPAGPSGCPAGADSGVSQGGGVGASRDRGNWKPRGRGPWALRLRQEGLAEGWEAPHAPRRPVLSGLAAGSSTGDWRRLGPQRLTARGRPVAANQHRDQSCSTNGHSGPR